MQPILIIVLAAVAGLPLGLLLRRNLATLGYRDEDEPDLPDPGPRWWVVWTSVLALASLAAAAASLSGRAMAYLPLLPLAVAGPWLAAVDFDVLRIPNCVLVPTAATTLLIVIGIAAAAQTWRAIVVSLMAAATTGGVFAGVHFATKGGIGFGDVKLASLIGFAAGGLGIGTVWAGVLIGSMIGLLWHISMRKAAPIPFGPWLLAGTWLCAWLLPPS